jgi:[ribosomal protein S5]-alanine N-acetyltransferase
VDRGEVVLVQRRTYKTKRLIIRPHRPSDYEEFLFAYTQCGRQKNKWDRGPMPARECSKKIFKSIIARHNKLAGLDHTYVWALYDRKSGRMVGNIDIFIICRDALQFANLGYRIFNLYWRCGYATEALRKAVPQILLDLRLNRLEAAIDQDNVASLRLAKAIRMRAEGLKKSHHFYKGKWEDQMVFTISRKDLRLPVLKPEIRRP